MHIGKHEVRRIGSSPFISTYELVGLSKDVTRILLESHSTHSNRTTEIQGQLSGSVREELTLSTVVLFNPRIDLDWRRVAVVLVELKYDSDSEVDEVFENGESLEMRLGGILRVARKTDPHQGQFGLWEWSVGLCFVPLKLIDRSVRGGIRVSGRGCHSHTGAGVA